MVTPVQDLRDDWESWLESDRKIWPILMGLLEIPFSFGLWLRLTLHIGALNLMHDVRGEPHPEVEGSTDLSPKSPVREPYVPFHDDIYIRITSSCVALALFSTPIFPLIPESPLVATLLYLNFAVLILDPLLIFLD